jgi:peroxiredoxin
LLNTVVVLLAVAGGWLLWPDAEPMPETTFNLIDGRNLHSSELRGKRVLLNFWSISCEVCLRDMPRLSRLHESLQDQDFTIIGVAMPHDPPPAVIETVQRLAPSYPIALDVHGEVNKAFGGIEVTPTIILVGPDGNISYTARGPLDEVRLRATLVTL